MPFNRRASERPEASVNVFRRSVEKSVSAAKSGALPMNPPLNPTMSFLSHGGHLSRRRPSPVPLVSQVSRGHVVTGVPLPFF